MNQYPMEKADVNTAKPASDEAPPTRRAYAAPRLTAFGSVSALTGAGSGLVAEFMSGMGLMTRHT